MGKKKNDERFQLKTPGSGQKEGNPVKSQAGATETKERANESITELTLLKNPTDKKETPVNKEVLRDYSCNEDDWSSEDDIPDSWEETEAAMRQSRRKESSEQTGKNNSGAQQSKGKQASEETLSIQQESRNGQENKQEEEVNDQDTPTVETTNLGSTMKKMSNIDRYFMKTLLTLAAGTEDKEALLDKLLTDFTKLRSLTLDATREVARLQGEGPGARRLVHRRRAHRPELDHGPDRHRSWFLPFTSKPFATVRMTASVWGLRVRGGAKHHLTLILKVPLRDLPNKPKCKWGLKLWARAGESGLCYDFDVYPVFSKGFYGDQGGYQLGIGAGVVIQLRSSLPDRENILIIGDNYFSSPHFVNELTCRKISYIGTVSENTHAS
ncbi:hypothetical protein HPB49_011228 [Dermacentor silvarum]|uniref:Uncharacterized protein n=1 Tax=Dermacentor silvarum TaxID=543639 RepID=A0ACB8C391_DERSI|nr:hypothetical protein HPB49_011228 [Dermacentor silvarum]